MKKTIILISSIFFFCGCQSGKDPITESDVMDLLANWEKAYLQKDLTLLNSVLHQNWTYAGNPDGSLSDKSATLNEVGKEGFQLISQELYDIKVDYYDDIAIVKGWEILKMMEANGDTAQYKLRFTDVYQKKEGNVQALSTHSSPIN